MSVSFPFWLGRCIRAVGSLPKKYIETPTERPFGYLFVDLKPQHDERYWLRTNIFPGEMQYVYVRKWRHYYELENAAWLSKSHLAIACRLSQRVARPSTNYSATSRPCKLHTSTWTTPLWSSSWHVQSAIRILRPPRNRLSCRSKESLGRRLCFERRIQQTELILASIWTMYIDSRFVWDTCQYTFYIVNSITCILYCVLSIKDDSSRFTHASWSPVSSAYLLTYLLTWNRHTTMQNITTLPTDTT